MLKWKLLLTALPFALVAPGLAFVRAEIFHIPSVATVSDLKPIITGAAVVMGIMIAGVTSDFKESERLPGELAALLRLYGECINSMLHLNKIRGDDDDLADVRHCFSGFVIGLEDWLIRATPVQECYALIRGLDTEMAKVSKKYSIDPADSFVAAITAMASQVITRINDIRTTNFLRSGHALLVSILAGLLTLLVFTEFKNVATQFLVIGFNGMIFIYLIRLISDLDDPFAYKPDGEPQGAAEVSIEPVLAYRRRLDGTLAPGYPTNERLNLWQREAADRLGYAWVTRQEVLSSLVEILLDDREVESRVFSALASRTGRPG